MIIAVITPDEQRREFPTAARFLTEETFNNLCLFDADDRLIAVYAQDQWRTVEVDSGDES